MIKTTTTLRARYADTDKMGVVHHARYLEWFEIGRTEMMRELGFPYTRLEAEGVGLPVIEAHAKYKRSVSYDDKIVVESRVEAMPKATIRVDYRLFDEEERLITLGYTVHPFVNEAGRPIRIPAVFKAVMAPYFSE